MWRLFELAPTPQAAVKADPQQVEAIIKPLGLFRKRTAMFKHFSKCYMEMDVRPPPPCFTPRLSCLQLLRNWLELDSRMVHDRSTEPFHRYLTPAGGQLRHIPFKKTHGYPFYPPPPSQGGA